MDRCFGSLAWLAASAACTPTGPGGADTTAAVFGRGPAAPLAASSEVPLYALAWSADSDQESAIYGNSVATADVNGDGYDDVAVAAELWDNPDISEGRVDVFLGSMRGLDAAPSWTVEGNHPLANILRIASAGDVNGDGFDDLLIGAWGYDSGPEDQQEGWVFLYLGSAAGLETSAAWIAESNQKGASFGQAVSSAGDVNGDGYDDVLVGAWGWDDGQTNEGRAYLYLGSPTGPADIPDWTVESDQTEALLGYAVASAGDVNGDGYDDLAIGTSKYDNGSTDEGRVSVYLGSPAGLGTTAWTAESNAPDARFGMAIAGAGDVNGDGYDDLIVSAEYYQSTPTTDEDGAVWVYHGSATGLVSAAAWFEKSDQAWARFGTWVTSAGDANDDGYDDIVVTAREWDGGEAYEGKAFVYLGSATGLEGEAAWTAESDQPVGFLGSGAAAGDVNGDGHPDLAIGCIGCEDGEVGEGMAFLYLSLGCGLTDADGDGRYDDCDRCPGYDDAVVDADQDTFCSVSIASAPADCDDHDASVYPGAPELCDGVDTACTGSVPADEADVDADGVLICESDCDDASAATYPGAPELCDGADNACAGAVPSAEIDADGDSVPPCAGDCDDADPAVVPGADEACDDGVDDDCDGAVDEACDAPAPPPAANCGCASAPSGATAWLGAAGLALAAGRRRRGPRSSVEAR